jgi:hypothetical protein
VRGRSDAAVERVDLAGFMRMSRVLTGVANLADEGAGRVYLDALLGDAAKAERLAVLWMAAGFGGATPPESIDEMSARGVYRDPELASLADTITRYWYTGVYDAPDAGPTVATYGGALAWRTLDYPAAGPSFCGGAFGHWAEAPSIGAEAQP